MRTFRRIAALPLIVVALVSAAPPALAAADTAVVVVNTTDDTYAWKDALRITRSNGDVVDEANGAAAVSSCERCRTAAIAFQVLLATGTATTVTDDNVAIALNQGCDACATYAGAFQLIVTTHTQVRFTESGNSRIDAIRAELQSLTASATFTNDVSDLDAFNEEVAALFDRLVAVVRAEVVRVGGGTLDTAVDVQEVV